MSKTPSKHLRIIVVDCRHESMEKERSQEFLASLKDSLHEYVSLADAEFSAFKDERRKNFLFGLVTIEESANLIISPVPFDLSHLNKKLKEWTPKSVPIHSLGNSVLIQALKLAQKTVLQLKKSFQQFNFEVHLSLLSEHLIGLQKEASFFGELEKLILTGGKRDLLEFVLLSFPLPLSSHLSDTFLE